MISATLAPTSSREARIQEIRNGYELLQEAEASRQAGDLPKARTVLENLTKRYPGYWAAQHTLGLVYTDLGLLQPSLDCFVRAAQVNPRHILSLTGLAGAYLALGSYDMAQGVLDQASALAPDDAGIHFLYGEIHLARNLYPEAEVAYRSALALDPASAAAHYKLGLCSLERGDSSSAAACFCESLRLDPEAFGPLNELALLPPDFAPADLDARLARSKGPANQPGKPGIAGLDFAKAIFFMARGAHDLAWKHAVAANSAIAPSRRAQALAIAESQRNSLGRLRELAVSEVEIAPADERFPRTILILGASRSGKTSIESLLSKWPAVRKGYESHLLEDCLQETMLDGGLLAAGSLDLLPKQLHQAFAERYLEGLLRLDARARAFTNTNPFLLADTVHLVKIVPNLRVVCVKRDIDDTVLSIFMRDYDVANDYAYDLRTIREHVVWYHQTIDELARLFPGTVTVVSYETLVAETRGVMQSLAAVVGLGDPPANVDLKTYDARGVAAPYLHWLRPTGA